ncbi:preprotein translocase subunit SecG [Christiangramia forsetii]|uniref:Protein-export membrane protein SecG n=2 Tax=Christiangramia forsetii TaxID=411153 RepID=A0M7D7_CHRFK|nr:preprotein translocase subunit SecG [Christiangramia forsetii]GGG28125.1 preprotein translocase subunit SecG [Christiangramia forsetii]CAL68532.1 membrane protein containing preprotein translocase subunit SecG [Christiangramia forsetii KT0803]
MSTFTIFLALIIIVAFLLVVVIMVQNPKGGGLSSSFGGGGQQIGGVKKTGDFLDKSTWTLATLLLVLILLSNVTIMDAPAETGTRVFESDEPVNTEAPATQTPAQQPMKTDSTQ